MRRQLVLPLALLFIALGIPSNAQTADVTVEEGAPLTVECALRVEEAVSWTLDGAAPPPDLRPAGEAAAAGRLTARLHAAAARPQHAGVYSCASPPAQRVRVHVRAAPARAPGEGASAAPAAADADVPLKQMLYDVGRFFSFNCSVPLTPGASIVWKKNGTEVEKVSDLRDRYKIEESVFRMTARTHEDDFGNYTCAVGAASQGWQLRGRPHAKLAANTNVVEGQKLKIVCKLVGKPYPDVKWVVANSTDDNSTTEVTLALGERAKLLRSEQGLEHGVLEVDAAVRSDAGVYTCVPPDGLAAATVVRVKDMYAALWPFLGICAEVFVLCAIILVYEKRRTKPELDDSDTDNHEQKKS